MDDLMLPLPGLSPVAGKSIVARFDGGQLSSDAGVLVLREFEQRQGIAEGLAACLDDPRSQAQVVHGLAEMIRFRMLMIAAGTPICPARLPFTVPSGGELRPCRLGRPHRGRTGSAHRSSRGGQR